MPKVGVAGATGVVGAVVLELLASREFPVSELRVFASPRSAGRKLEWKDQQLVVESVSEANFDGLDVVITSMGSELAQRWAPVMTGAGAIVIDNSSAFRRDPAVPLVIPEINGEAALGHTGIIANPNCTTAAVLMALAPIHKAVGIRAVISSSYQAASGTGREAVLEFLDQLQKGVDQIDSGEPLNLPEPRIYSHPLAFNVFPHCETFPAESLESTEEEKMRLEMRKILDAPALEVSATAVRVPVVTGHSASVSISCGKPVSVDEARLLIAGFPGTKVLDDPGRGIYPTPLQAAGIDEVLVGRIRPNPILENGLSLFVCGDNLRKGAALNAVQIAELVTA